MVFGIRMQYEGVCGIGYWDAFFRYYSSLDLANVLLENGWGFQCDIGRDIGRDELLAVCSSRIH